MTNVIASSEPHCKKLGVLRHPQEFNDMSQRAALSFSRYQLSEQFHSCFLNSKKVVEDFIFLYILGTNSQFYNYKEFLYKESVIFTTRGFLEFGGTHKFLKSKGGTEKFFDT